MRTNLTNLRELFYDVRFLDPEIIQYKASFGYLDNMTEYNTLNMFKMPAEAAGIGQECLSYGAELWAEFLQERIETGLGNPLPTSSLSPFGLEGSGCLAQT